MCRAQHIAQFLICPTSKWDSMESQIQQSKRTKENDNKGIKHSEQKKPNRPFSKVVTHISIKSSRGTTKHTEHIEC